MQGAQVGTVEAVLPGQHAAGTQPPADLGQHAILLPARGNVVQHRQAHRTAEPPGRQRNSRSVGTDRAIEVPSLGALNKGADAFVGSVSCASADSCAAGGDYTDVGDNGQGFVAVERHGAWGKATAGMVPAVAFAALRFYCGNRVRRAPLRSDNQLRERRQLGA